MAKLSAHAKERLRGRFNADDDDIIKIGAVLSTPGRYTVSARSAKEEIRDIVYNGRGIRGVVKHGVVATCLTEWMGYYVECDLLDPNDIVEQESVDKEIHHLKSTLGSYKDIIDKYETLPFFFAVSRLIERRYYRRKNERNKIRT